MIRVFLDGRLLEESPAGINDLKDTVKYDQTTRLRSLTQDATLIFYEDGYRYIKRVYDDGFCNEVAILIEEDEDEIGQWEKIHEGIIRIGGCEFGIEPFYVKCNTDDNSYYARINQNKNLKALFTSTRSKTDKGIAACPYSSIKFFTPSTGTYGTANRYVYRAFDAMKFLVAWMSDGAIGFRSDAFDTGGVCEDAGIILAKELRDGYLNLHDKQPEIAWQEVFSELNKEYSLSITIEESLSGPILRVDREDDLYAADSSVQLDFVKDIRQKVDTSRLYASFKAGSETIDDSSGAVQFPETTRLYGFRPEQYPTVGQCNLDQELDAQNSWIISSNIIEQIYVNNVADYDDKIVLVQVDWVNSQAKRSNWLSAPTPYFYNEGLNNDHKLQRWLHGIPLSVANFLGGADGRFYGTYAKTQRIQGGGGPGTYNLGVSARDDFSGPTNFDDGNNYGNGTAPGTLVSILANQRYTASSGGFFRFKAGLNTLLHTLSFGTGGNIELTVTRFNAADAVVSSQNFFWGITNAVGVNLPLNYEQEFAFNLNATDYVRIFWKFNITSNHTIDWEILPSSYFTCTFTTFGGGIWATVEDLDFKCILYLFRFKMTRKQWKKILRDLSLAIEFNTDGTSNYKSWIDTITYNRGQGQADFSLISSQRLKP